MTISTVYELLDYTSATSSTDIDFTNPTYDSVKNQLYTLIYNNETTANLNISSTISILIDQIAMICDFNNYSIESALQEAYFESAQLESSIILKARNHGCHIQRNIPAHCTVSLYRQDTTQRITIPKLTQFSIMNNTYLFNRQPIIFNAGVSQIDDITLYEGEIKQEQYTASGAEFQSYVIGTNQFKTSDTDVYVTINNEEWTRDINGVFTFGSYETKFYENTTSDGYVQVKFGDNVYGKIPPSQSIIYFTYVNTNGTNISYGINNYPISITGYSEISGTAMSDLSGGDLRRDAYFYKYMGPSISATNNRAITREDFRAIICQYEGVQDCKVRGQAEIAPYRKEWMNVLAISVLTRENWTNNQWDTFVEWLQDNYAVQNMQFVRVDPKGFFIDIDVTLYCFPSADLQVMYSRIENGINNLFERKVGTIGKSIMLSDISSAILTAGGVQLDSFKLNSPTNDYIMQEMEYARLGELTIDTQFTSRSSDSIV